MDTDLIFQIVLQFSILQNKVQLLQDILGQFKRKQFGQEINKSDSHI